MLASLALAAFALADNTVADGGGLTPVSVNPDTSNMVFGDVTCGATTTKQALIAVTRNGGINSTNVFKDGTTVTVTAHSVAGRGERHKPGRADHSSRQLGNPRQQHFERQRGVDGEHHPFG